MPQAPKAPKANDKYKSRWEASKAKGNSWTDMAGKEHYYRQGGSPETGPWTPEEWAKAKRVAKIPTTRKGLENYQSRVIARMTPKQWAEEKKKAGVKD